MRSSGSLFDIDWANAVRGGVDGLMVQLDPGLLRIDFAELHFGDLFIRRWALNRRVALEEGLSDGWTRFVLSDTAAGDVGKWCGTDIEGTSLLVFSGARVHYCVMPSGWTDIEIGVRNETLLDSGLVDEEFLRRVRDPEDANFELPQASARYTATALDQMLSNQSIALAIATDSTQRALLRDLVLAHLEAHLRLTDGREESAKKRDKRHFHHVKTALAFWSSTDHAGASVNALCKETGIHPKALQRAFNEVFGTSPYRYALQSRLARARASVLQERNSISLTEISHNLGFSSSSEFARHYKELFGEQPSATRTRIH